MADTLKAPFPYYGGKSVVAPLVWQYLGNPDNFIEPFAGSAAVLLARPQVGARETLNDADHYIANFWRATKANPEAVADHADWPVSETDLHARHRWLVLSPAAAKFRKRMVEDPDYYDCRVAGWWVWGLSQWIGAQWCHVDTANWRQRPMLMKSNGVHKDVHLRQKRPYLGGEYAPGRGVHKQAAGRPQLADAYSRGRGVHGNDRASACAERRAWLLDWFGKLRDRLRPVRVCCGDWLRVCDSPSVTTRLGVTGIFADPPYSNEADRDMQLYAVECGKVAHEVRAYCLERGDNPLYRIVLAGYAGEGHEELERAGWSVEAWKTNGGYGNRSTNGRGRDNASRERLWISPHCRRRRGLFA